MRLRPVLLAALLVSACSSTSSSTTTAAPSTTPAPTAAAAPTTTVAPEPTTTGAAAPSTSAEPAATTTAAVRPSPAHTVAELLALGRPVILAHAGGENTAPHSSPYGFAEGVKAGVDILDVDLQLTADDVLVVQHDDSTGRTANEDLVVRDTPYETLHALDNAYWFSSACHNTCTDQPASAYDFRGIRTGERPAPDGYSADDFAITAFAEMMAKYPDWVFNIEIKGTAPAAFDTADALVKLVQANGSAERIVVTSFDDAVVDHFHAAMPEVVMTPGLNMSTDFVLGGKVPPLWAPILQVPPEYQGLQVFTADYVAKTHALGLKTWVWPNGAGEDVAGYRSLLDLGADGVNASDLAAGVQALTEFLAGT